MSSVEHSKLDASLNERLATGGFRFTPQRQHVYDVLLQTRDHPTVEDVFIRAKSGMGDISMATVYNCLDALVKCGLVRQVNLDRAATRYCPNMKEHCHFYCEHCGGLFDLDFKHGCSQSAFEIPEGFRVKHVDISVRGICVDCSKEATR